MTQEVLFQAWSLMLCARTKLSAKGQALPGSENVFFSSLSLFTALALVRLGARGDCASQIDKVSLDCITNYDFCN